MHFSLVADYKDGFTFSQTVHLLDTKFVNNCWTCLKLLSTDSGNIYIDINNDLFTLTRTMITWTQIFFLWGSRIKLHKL